MPRNLNVTRAAEDDIGEARRWYEQAREGLGLEFMDELDALLQRLAEQPFLYQEVDPSIRKALVHRFPYLVFYTVSDHEVAILAVVHAAQDPAYIRSRLGA